MSNIYLVNLQHNGANSFCVQVRLHKNKEPAQKCRFQVLFTNFSLHLGQEIAILPFPLGTRTG